MKMRTKVRAVTAALLALAALTATGPAQAADPDPGLALSNFELRPIKNRATLQDRVATMNQEFDNIGVNEILQNANNTGRFSSGVCNDAATAGTSTPQNLVSSFCFDTDDNGNSNSEWIPQGVTGVGDADADMTWGDATTGWDPAAHKPLLVTWYNKDDWNGDKVNDDVDVDGTNTAVKGVRISFIDSGTGKYAHVLLVYPFTNDSGNASWMGMRTTQKYGAGSLHAGGIVWYGYKLYVADTNRGFRVFDLRDIIDLQGNLPEGTSYGTDKTAVGRQSGVFYAHGYRYILPESDGWTNAGCDTLEMVPSPVCDMQDGDKTCTRYDVTPRFSSASLDRSASVRHVVTGEWCARPNTTEYATGRVVRWPMLDDGGLPKVSSDGLWKGDAAYRIPFDYRLDPSLNGGIQGVASYNGTYFLNQSLGTTSNGVTQVARPNSDGRLETLYTLQGAIGLEDLTIWPDRADPMFWTVTEYGGARMMYGIRPTQP
ncbi:hypothetical protein SRB5_59690 [Streptomyces sp. RB5]|uniref:Secreted protein n=1 Tax=Streptomyces smaragdinus TaxID=2585196 RepID=A0A7K0CQK9_9ACTN|nr:hypothetical protein [Streptomyces smaragdinus]MQY15778.1 hypothetical protein [Streptomyces smaragdinus]